MRMIIIIKDQLVVFPGQGVRNNSLGHRMRSLKRYWKRILKGVSHIVPMLGGGLTDRLQTDQLRGERSQMTDADLVKAFIESCFVPPGSKENEALAWADRRINALSFHSPKKCWEVVLDIVSATDDEWVLTMLGVGPIEDMLSSYPEETIAMIERDAPQNSKLRYALANVWQSDTPDDVWNRLQAII